LLGGRGLREEKKTPTLLPKRIGPPCSGRYFKRQVYDKKEQMKRKPKGGSGEPSKEGLFAVPRGEKKKKTQQISYPSSKWGLLRDSVSEGK